MCTVFVKLICGEFVPTKTIFLCYDNIYSQFHNFSDKKTNSQFHNDLSCFLVKTFLHFILQKVYFSLCLFSNVSSSK